MARRSRTSGGPASARRQLAREADGGSRRAKRSDPVAAAKRRLSRSRGPMAAARRSPGRVGDELAAGQHLDQGQGEGGVVRGHEPRVVLAGQEGTLQGSILVPAHVGRRGIDEHDVAGRRRDHVVGLDVPRGIPGRSTPPRSRGPGRASEAKRDRYSPALEHGPPGLAPDECADDVRPSVGANSGLDCGRRGRRESREGLGLAPHHLVRIGVAEDHEAGGEDGFALGQRTERRRRVDRVRLLRHSRLARLAGNGHVRVATTEELGAQAELGRDPPRDLRLQDLPPASPVASTLPGRPGPPSCSRPWPGRSSERAPLPRPTSIARASPASPSACPPLPARPPPTPEGPRRDRARRPR